MGRKKKEKLYKEEIFKATQKMTQYLLNIIQSDINNLNYIEYEQLEDNHININNEIEKIQNVFKSLKEVYLILNSFDANTQNIMMQQKNAKSLEEKELIINRIDYRLEIRGKYEIIANTIESNLDAIHQGLYRIRLLIGQSKSDSIEGIFWDKRKDVLKHKK